MSYVGYLIAILIALTYFHHIDYEKDKAGKIVFQSISPATALKATAALAPLYLAYFPTDIPEASRNFLNASALTVIAVPLALPFWTIPREYEKKLWVVSACVAHDYLNSAGAGLFARFGTRIFDETF